MSELQGSSGERGDASSLVRGRLVLTGIDDKGQALFLRDAAVVHSGGIITAIGPFHEMKSLISEGAAVTGSDESVVLPGLVNSHHHVGLTPLQLGSPDMDLEPWIIHRLGARHVDPYLDTLYSAFEMIQSGVTTVQHIDGMTFASARQWESRPGKVLQAYRDIGMRVSYSVGMFDQNRFVYEPDNRFFDRLGPDLKDRVRALFGEEPLPRDQQLALGFDRLRDEWDGAGRGRIRIQLAPLALQWCSDQMLAHLAGLADEHQINLHMHLLETVAQRRYAATRCPEGVLRHLSALGIASPLLTLGHGVWLRPDDLEVMAATDTRLCYNASSNLRLKSGIAPILPAREAGIVIGMGIDEAGINDDRDMLQELRLAMSLQRLPGGKTLSAGELLRMATEHGAATTSFGGAIGSLRVGAAADMVLFDWEDIRRPYLDPDAPTLDALVRRARASKTRAVIVDGEVIFRDGEFINADQDDVLRQLSAGLAGEPSAEELQRRQAADALLPHVTSYYAAEHEQARPQPYYVFNSRS
jgi:5-methylthioadenosine/S-adenosylhomocysteine deaminase